MKEKRVSIVELAEISGVSEHTILEILEGIREPELNVMCKIVEGLGICVHELCGDEEKYAVAVRFIKCLADRFELSYATLQWLRYNSLNDIII